MIDAMGTTVRKTADAAVVPTISRPGRAASIGQEIYVIRILDGRTNYLQVLFGGDDLLSL